jgi:vitamin B12 transporter
MKKKITILLLLGLLSVSFTQNNQKLQTITLDIKAGNASNYFDRHNTYRVIDSETLDSWVEKDFYGAIKRAPELNIVNAGGSTTLFLQGGASNQTKVMYRGVDLYDPSTPQGTPLFNAISIANIGSIEVVKGASSVFYGNSALAGVINIVPSTKRTTKYSALFGGALANHSFSTGFQKKGVSFGFSYNDLRTNQLSWTSDPVTKNNVHQVNFEADLALELGEHSKVSLFFADNQNNTEIDVVSRNSVTFAIVPGFGIIGTLDTKHNLFGIEGQHDLRKLGNIGWKYTLSNIQRDNIDDFNGTLSYKGFINDVDINWGSNLHSHDIIIGSSQRNEKYSGTWDPEVSQSDASLYAIVSGKKLINYSIGARNTSYKNDKNVTTYSLSFWKKFLDFEAKFNYSTGYRRPSLYEKFAGWGSGNPNLNAENSKIANFDLSYEGINGVILASSLFSSTITDKIDYSTSYYNVTSDTKIDGYSLGIDVLLIPYTKRFSLNYVNTNSRNDSGQSNRVPREKATLDLLFDVYGVDLSLFYSMVSSRRDGSVTMPAYNTLDLALSKKFDYFEVFLKGINVLGENYQEINGYNTINNLWYIGVRTEI